MTASPSPHVDSLADSRADSRAESLAESLAVDLGARLHRVAGDTESEFWLLLDLGTIVLD